MFGFVARFIGVWFVAGCLVALVVDAAKSIGASALVMTHLGDTLFALTPSMMVAAQAFVQERIEPTVGGWLWDPVIQWILLLPTWAVLAFFGFLLTYLGRRRRVRTAYA